MAISGSIKPLKDKNGNYIFPETSSEAVYCPDGTNIEQKLTQNMSSINTDITNLKQKNTEFSSQLEQIEDEFNKTIANVTNGNESATNSEIVQARGKYTVLNERISDFDNYPFSKKATLPKFDKSFIKFISIKNADVSDVFYISNTRKKTGDNNRQIGIKNANGNISFSFNELNTIEPTGIEKFTKTINGITCTIVVDWSVTVTEKNNWTIAETELSPLVYNSFENEETIQARGKYNNLNERISSLSNYPFKSECTLKNINKSSFPHISIFTNNLNDRFYVSNFRKMNGAGERWITIKNLDSSLVFNMGGKNESDGVGGYINPTGFEIFSKTINGVTINVEINWDVKVFERGDYTISDTEISKECFIVSSLLSTQSKLNGKKMIALGDSIMWGGGNNGVGIADLIANKYNMQLEKLAVSGATMADCNGRSSIYKQIDNATMENPDFILINGGYNDCNNYNEIGLGDIVKLEGLVAPNDNCYSGFNTTTYCGAFETLMRKLIDKYPTSQVIFITTPKIGNTFYDRTDASRPFTYKDIYDKTIEGCKKWGNSVVDLFNECRLTTASQLRSLFSAYVPDNIHPNEQGYIIYYLPPIVSKMESLIM